MEKEKVEQYDLMEAVEIIIAGQEKKDRIMTESEKKNCSISRSRTRFSNSLTKKHTTCTKITIVPRKCNGALGYTMQMPEEEKYLMNKQEILDQITTYLSGRAAEEVIFHNITTGASNDIEKATELARNMVAQYGMSEKFDMVALESIQNKYLDGRNVRNCAETTSAEIDEEVLRIIKTMP